MSSTSIVLESNKYYRCFRSLKAPSISTWTSSASYSKGSNIYPTSYNGYYYQAQQDGASGSVEPTFPAMQHNTVVDNNITWKAIPDTKPGSGKNWSSYFIQDDSVSSGSAYSPGDYHRSGDFTLQDDEFEIVSAYISQGGKDTQLTLISDSTFYSIPDKAERGEPTHLYLENVGMEKKYHLYPYPSEAVIANGTILHVSVKLKAEAIEGSSVVSIPSTMHQEAVYFIANYMADIYKVPTSDRATINQRYESFVRGSRTLEGSKISPYLSVIMPGY